MESNYHYTSERNVQIVIALLKANNISKVVASPGTTNIAFVASIMHDSFFEIISSVDERSAAYIACGIAEESGEPVVLSCTGATASRNYLSGLTEAYYRKLPILAITSTQDVSNVGHLQAQVIDRSQQPKDVVRYSANLQSVKNDIDEWDCNIKANTAILELKRHGGGPVHLNLTTVYSRDFSTEEIPFVRKISRIESGDKMPNLPSGRIAIYVGSHLPFSQSLSDTLDRFCEANDAVVFCEPTSNYKGKFRVMYGLPGAQLYFRTDINKTPDLLIHIGEVSDFIGTFSGAHEVWRVNPDGEIRDRLRKLTYVFEMEECDFFAFYANHGVHEGHQYLQSCQRVYSEVYESLPELPFSNLWIASKVHKLIPDHSELHLGILNSLRSWNLFDFNKEIDVFCNEGGFGIDGNISALVGASLIHPDKTYYGIVGDLAFFYDMNVLGNHHVGNNIRLLLVNNGVGSEFHYHGNPGSMFMPETPKYISAGGHYGNQSRKIVKHIAEDWGYQYISASSKDEFLNSMQLFFTDEVQEKPFIFEVFTNVDDEVKALDLIKHIVSPSTNPLKKAVKNLIGDSCYEAVRKIVKK